MSYSPLALIVTLAGGYMLFRLGFFFILHPFRTLGIAFRGASKKGTARSLALALSGTLGVGNVVGVALGIIIGGAGSVFWMLISAIFATVLKYSEVVLASGEIYREKDGTHGGMHRVIARSFGKMGAPLALIYTASVLILSLAMGAALQSATLITTFGEIFDTPPIVSAVFLAIAVFLGVVGGTKIIERVAAIVIPVTTILYIIICVSAIIICRERIPDVLRLILHSAFTPRAGVGGILGVILSRPLSEGFSRGMLSNEAGAGTSSMAHARGASLNPAVAGLMGGLEVVFDTVILSTLTALAILTAVPDPTLYSDGMALVLAALTSALGSSAALPLLISVAAFAYSTVICWYFYGTEAVRALFGGSGIGIFLPIYLLTVIFGPRLGIRPLVFICDLLLLVMSIITCTLIIKSSDRVRTLSELGGVISPRKRKKVKLLRLNKSDHR